ncbi:class I SAM-dependent methyltransferase family protein [Candidatus Daviesbacteria bacterium]|nr:class I SAM-dependent methyltransferase family protein [Candidatus Daviesbacteria bacterium]
MVTKEAETSVIREEINPFSLIDPNSTPDQQIKRVLAAVGHRLGETPYGKREFELESPIGEALRCQLISWMLSQGNGGYELFRGSGNLCQISDEAASHAALERMYVGPNTSLDRKVSHFDWSRLFIENIHNAMAVRNRLRIVESTFTDYMSDALAKNEGDLNVLSVAAGSSRGIMESLKVLNGEGSARIKLRMVDSSRDALRDGSRLVKELGIEESVDFIRAHFLSFKRYLEEGYRPDFVEVVGLMDYLFDPQIIVLVSELREHMADGGMLLYSNIQQNDERDFTHKIVGWPQMEYRTGYKLYDLALISGFVEGNIDIVKEPLGIYNLIKATK